MSGDQGSVHAFMLVLRWSLDALVSGVWPRVDHRGVRYPPQSREGKKAGKYLAGGFYGIVMALIGDLDYMNKFLGQPHWQVLQTLAISVYVPRQALSRGKTVAQTHHGEQRPTQQEAGKQTPTGPRSLSCLG